MTGPGVAKDTKRKPVVYIVDDDDGTWRGHITRRVSSRSRVRPYSEPCTGAD
jgi:hypothetical protein